jgi:hypothetical protein
MFFKVNFLALIFIFITISCIPAKPTILSSITPVPQAASETPVFTAFPKQNNLIFIEFFAGT